MPNKQSYIPAILCIEDYELNLFIGVHQFERQTTQKIYITIKISYDSMPKSVYTDDLSHSLCYDLLCEKISFYNDKIFNTIERLGSEVMGIVKKEVNDLQVNNIEIHIKKFPKIHNLQGGVTFVINSA